VDFTSSTEPETNLKESRLQLGISNLTACAGPDIKLEELVWHHFFESLCAPLPHRLAHAQRRDVRVQRSSTEPETNLKESRLQLGISNLTACAGPDIKWVDEAPLLRKPVCALAASVSACAAKRCSRPTHTLRSLEPSAVLKVDFTSSTEPETNLKESRLQLGISNLTACACVRRKRSAP
jgi:hypothetical protein